MNSALFPLFCCQHTQHKSCTQFSFFQIITQNVVNDGFQYPILSAIILQVARWSSFQNNCYPSDVFIRFRRSWPSAPLYVFIRLLNRHKPAIPSKYCSTQHRQVTKHFYKHFSGFRSRKSRFTTKFYRRTLFKIFFHGNL